MPMIAIAFRFKAAYDQLQRAADRALRRELRARAKKVKTAAKASITKSPQSSAPGHPFKSKSGATKRLLGAKVSKRTAFVGFRKGKAKRDKKTGKKIRPARAVPNILEHGSREVAARPVLEPALERTKRSPFRSRL